MWKIEIFFIKDLYKKVRKQKNNPVLVKKPIRKQYLREMTTYSASDIETMKINIIKKITNEETMIKMGIFSLIFKCIIKCDELCSQTQIITFICSRENMVELKSINNILNIIINSQKNKENLTSVDSPSQTLKTDEKQSQLTTTPEPAIVRKICKFNKHCRNPSCNYHHNYLQGFTKCKFGHTCGNQQTCYFCHTNEEYIYVYLYEYPTLLHKTNTIIQKNILTSEYIYDMIYIFSFEDMNGGYNEYENYINHICNSNGIKYNVNDAGVEIDISANSNSIDNDANSMKQHISKKHRIHGKKTFLNKKNVRFSTTETDARDS